MSTDQIHDQDFMMDEMLTETIHDGSKSRVLDTNVYFVFLGMDCRSEGSEEYSYCAVPMSDKVVPKITDEGID